jgi:hypothetical protein
MYKLTDDEGVYSGVTFQSPEDLVSIILDSLRSLKPGEEIVFSIEGISMTQKRFEKIREADL